MNLGDLIPNVSLPGESGAIVKPGDVIGYQSLMMLFYSPACPFSRAYSKRLGELFDHYRDENLRTFFINLNPESREDDEIKMELMASGADERNFLSDVNLNAVKKFNVHLTPEAFLFDRDRHLVYQGAIDDNWRHPELVTRVYLVDALEYSLDAEDIDFPEIEPIGTPVDKLIRKAGNK